MFKKILIANRGEIAVRIERTCREMGIQTVALYKALDRSSLHVRLADECVQLDSPLGFMDGEAIIQIAKAKGVDAIHPGYGFLSEDPEFSRACEAAGIVLIAPPASVLSLLRNKPGVLNACAPSAARRSRRQKRLTTAIRWPCKIPRSGSAIR